MEFDIRYKKFFSWCINLNHVTIPKSVKIVSKDVLSAYFKLFNITIGEGVFDKMEN